NPRASFFRGALRFSGIVESRGAYVRFLQMCLLSPSRCLWGLDKNTPLEQQAAVAAYRHPAPTSLLGTYQSSAFTRLREVSMTARVPERLRRDTGAPAGDLHHGATLL